MRDKQVLYFLFGVLVWLGTPVVRAEIPEDVSYTVREDQNLPKVKRSVTVTLNKEVSKELLGEIAEKIRAADSKTYQRTFILYYLTGMDEKKGAWASTHFDPTLEVKILGFARGDKARETSESPPEGARLVGTWVDRGVAARVIRVLQNGDLFLMSMKFKDGSSLETELTTRNTSDGLWLAKKSEARGDYYVINKNGDLESRDADGLIATYPKN